MEKHNVYGETRKGTLPHIQNVTGRKAAALALCVSLWMAGGSVAGATEVTVEDSIAAGVDNPSGLKRAPVTNLVLGINEATGCILNITGGDGTTNLKDFAASVNGGDVLSGNTVNMTGGKVSNLYGAYADTRSANYNTVNMEGGTVTGAHGAYGEIVVGNTVNFKGGTVSNIFGGLATTKGTAKNNIVNLYRAPTNNGVDVRGGYATEGTVESNTINIFASMTLGAVHVGYAFSGKSFGNTLNIAAKDVTVSSVGSVVYVQNLNFYLPSDIASGDTMLTVSGAGSDLGGVKIGVALQKGANLEKGDQVTLVNGAPIDATTLTTAPVLESLALEKSYSLDISADGKATVENVNTSSESAKSLVETRAATTTFINAGADMLASQGFKQAANAVAVEAAEQSKNGSDGGTGGGGFTPFAAFGGSSMRAESGSYVDTRGFGLNIGFAREFSNSQGKLLFGPIVEYGGGNYDSYLDNGTHGDGGAHYFGLGVMARQVNHGGSYYEGSLRGGRVTSDYKSDLGGMARVDYDSASNYFAAHLGVGKVFDMGNNNTLDGYFKYFFSHQAGDTTTIHIAGMDDETGDFDAVDSHRIRFGARLTHKINDKNKLYGGLAYQYEFGGEARAHFNGIGAPSPSVKGSSGMLELGWQVKPGEGPLTLDLGVTGWAGKQRGGSVQLGAIWSF